MKYTSLLLLLLIITPGAFALRTELLATDPAPAQAGEYVDVTFRMQVPIEGPQRHDVELLIQENPFITLVSPAATYTRLGAADEVTATLRIYIDERAPEGNINLVSVADSEEGTIETEHILFIEGAQTEAELAIGKVETTPKLLLPDTENNKLTLQLQNLGEKKAELITATLRIPEERATEAFAFSTRDSLASLSSGEEGELEFYIDIEEETRQNIPAQLSLQYRTKRDQGEVFDVFSRVLPLMLPIDDGPYLQISKQEALSSFVTGSTENVLRITIRNDGEDEATDVRVRLFPDISYPFTFELTSQYIGAKIAPGQEVTMDVMFEVLKDATNREYPVFVELESLVGTTRYTQDDTISITVLEGNTPQDSQIGYIIIGLVILAAIVFAILTRRRKNGKA